QLILGIEAPLWSETLRTIKDIEYMAFPRLPGLAELGWSPLAGRNWNEYRLRLGAAGERLTAMDVNFYRAPEVDFR
ncbi:MAG TPA: family 20 glycosylhydrolase, partial [Anaerolineaceae bacterium]